MENKDLKTNKLFELLYRWKNSNDDKDLIKFIQENQECLNLKDGMGSTPLIYSLRNKHKENIIKLLINNKTDLNQKDKYGNSPLMIALKIKRNQNIIKMVKVL